MHQFLNYFGLIEHQFLAKREVPSGGKRGGKLLLPRLARQGRGVRVRGQLTCSLFKND